MLEGKKQLQKRKEKVLMLTNVERKGKSGKREKEKKI